VIANAKPIVVFAPDLLMRQQIVEGLKAAGVSARGTATPARFATALAEGASGLILELDGVGVDGIALVTQLVTNAETSSIPLVGFCAHTRVDLIKGARAAGATKVVARGELVRRLPEIVRAVIGTEAGDRP
jgi:DNA-binding NarL/FixJ family response regulator